MKFNEDVFINLEISNGGVVKIGVSESSHGRTWYAYHVLGDCDDWIEQFNNSDYLCSLPLISVIDNAKYIGTDTILTPVINTQLFKNFQIMLFESVNEPFKIYVVNDYLSCIDKSKIFNTVDEAKDFLKQYLFKNVIEFLSENV